MKCMLCSFFLFIDLPSPPSSVNESNFRVERDLNKAMRKELSAFRFERGTSRKTNMA